MSEQPQRDIQAINTLKLRIAQELGETARPVFSKIWYIIHLKGLDFAEELLGCYEHFVMYNAKSLFNN